MKPFLNAEVLISVYRHVGSGENSRDASGFVSRDLPILAGPCWQSSCPGWRSPGFRGPGTRNSFCKASCEGGAGGKCLLVPGAVLRHLPVVLKGIH